MVKAVRILVLLMALPAFLLAQGAAPALPKAIQRAASVEGITEYQLQNGLKLLLFPDPTKQTITVNVTYLVGSLEENYGETGMAHLLEHMLFRGTPRHANIKETMTQRGARYNASTWLDRTNYFEIIAASDENLDWALDLEADRMVNSLIARKDLDQEMTVVRNEFESGENDPFRILMERMMSTAYLWHNYGHSTIGARSDIENVPIERLQAFYRAHYQPDNAVLLIAGKFDEPKALTLVQKYFGVIPRPKRVLQQLYTSEPTQDGERQVTLRRVGDVQVAAVLYHVPSGAHPDFPAMDILNFILSDTPSGRLYKKLVEAKKASSVTGFSFQVRQPGTSFFAAEVRQESSLDEAKDVLIQTVEGVPANPVTKEEVERARTAMLKDMELTLNSSDRIGLELSEWMAMGDWRLFFLYRDLLKKVTPEDVTRVAATYFKQSNRTLGLFYPTKSPDRAEIPPEPNVQEMVKDYKGEAPIAAGETFDPSPANIEARTIRSAAGPIKMALLPKKTRGEAVRARLMFRIGNEAALKGRATAGSLAGDMLDRGTSKHTRQQIQDEFDRLKARVSVAGSPTDIMVRIETERAGLPDVLRLVAEILKEPTFPENEFEQLKQETLASIEQEQNDPNSIAGTAFQRHMDPYPPEDVRYTQTMEEEIAAIKAAKLEDVKKFYADFYGSASVQASVVGDFDDKEISALITELFGTWKCPTAFQRVPSEYQEAEAVNQSFEVQDKANAFFIAGQNLKIRDDNPDYPALALGNYILGSSSSSRPNTRIREKEGLSYSVGSSLSASSIDVAGSFTAFAIYAPENEEKLEAAFKEEIQRMLKDGFTADELETAKKGIVQARQVSRAQDSELSGRLLSYLYLDRTLKWDEEFEKKIQALTPQQVSEAMRKYIDLSKMTIMKAGSFAKKKD
ncbi:MAG TPA: pitrilysin family protein [Acidobacteriota bacterium]|nr:pitrilysin family protein [Acidobacteriota bacterium]